MKLSGVKKGRRVAFQAAFTMDFAECLLFFQFGSVNFVCFSEAVPGKP